MGDESQAIPENILKCRDDHRPVPLVKCDESPNREPTFQIQQGASCSWARPDEMLGPEKLRPRIEPWLTALCQSEHISLLLGSGLTHAIHRLATGSALPGMACAGFGSFTDTINAEAKRTAALCGRDEGNIEDQIRVAIELMRGQQILGLSDENANENANALRVKLAEVLTQFASDICKAEHGVISAADEGRENAFNYLVSFLMSFASRSGTRERLHIFTTNYDRVVEAGAEAAGLHLLDRFVGSLAPVFRSSRLNLDMHYNPPGIRGEPRYLEGVARFTKLHGSLDWIDCDRDIRRVGIPFGSENLTPFLDASNLANGDATRLMIYPNAAKDRETTAYPYVDLFRDFAAAICRPNHALVTFGYGFGDEHLNRVVEDMLTIPSTHLVMISYDDPLGRITRIYEKMGRHAQISMLIGNHVGEFQSLVDHYLPKPAIDRTTFRMAEILKARWGTNQAEGPHDSVPGSNDAGGAIDE